jgi:hypothetical protein
MWKCGNATAAFALMCVHGSRHGHLPLTSRCPFQNGYTFVYPTTDDVGVHVASPDDLTVYQFGGKILKHHFCAVCGVPVFVRVCGPPPDVVAAMSEAEKAGRDQMITMHPVNLHALDGVEWDLLKVNKIQGKEREPKYTID